jgi:hypothetical protein
MGEALRGQGRPGVIVLGASLLAMACTTRSGGPPTSSRTSTLAVKEIPNPAAPGSGEASLTSLADGRAVLSWIEPAGKDAHAVRLAVLGVGGQWSEPRTIARGPGFFVNWADFPAVAPLADGTLFAHWLERSGSATYSYEVRLARSSDEGRTWSEALTPHADRSAVEHGFVSMADDGAGRMALVWLDGRAKDGTALLSARVGAQGPASAEERVDGRVCDCCQTALVRTPRGLLAAFRDRTEDEVRDVAVARFEAGAWTPARVVAADHWKIDGCPVNGPALAVDGERVAVAWFTMEPVARVRLALSPDGGASWGSPVDIHEGRPLGRVDVAFRPDGDLAVSFLEQATLAPSADGMTADAAAAPAGAAGAARLRLRFVGRDGRAGALIDAATASPARSSGFPRLERAGSDLLLAWRDTAEPGRIRTAVVAPTAR